MYALKYNQAVVQTFKSSFKLKNERKNDDNETFV